MSVGSTALCAGHLFGEMVCPSFGVSQLEGAGKPADNCHACKHCGHAWELDTVCTANPLAYLRPYLSKVQWYLNQRVIGSVYLLLSL